jgi:hypothetical protein
MLRKLPLVAALAGVLALPTAAAAWDGEEGWDHHDEWEHGQRHWEHGDRGYYSGRGHHYGWRRRDWDDDVGYYRRRCWAWNGWQWVWVCN